MRGAQQPLQHSVVLLISIFKNARMPPRRRPSPERRRRRRWPGARVGAQGHGVSGGLSTSKWFFNSAIPFSGTSRPCKRATTVLHPQRQSKRQSKRERACACLSGWGGPFCGSLKLNPAAALIVASQIFFHPTNGGGWYVENSVPDDGGALWHGFVTELEQTKRARAVQRRLHRPGFAVLSP